MTTKRSTKQSADSGPAKALEVTIANLNKQRYGEGIIMKLGEATRLDVASIPTGSLSLDIALGVGGIPRGRIIEVYGPESRRLAQPTGWSAGWRGLADRTRTGRGLRLRGCGACAGPGLCAQDRSECRGSVPYRSRIQASRPWR